MSKVIKAMVTLKSASMPFELQFDMANNDHVSALRALRNNERFSYTPNPFGNEVIVFANTVAVVVLESASK